MSNVKHESWVGEHITGALLGPIEKGLGEIPLVGGLLEGAVKVVDEITDWTFARIGDVLENLPIFPVKK